MVEGGEVMALRPLQRRLVKVSFLFLDFLYLLWTRDYYFVCRCMDAKDGAFDEGWSIVVVCNNTRGIIPRCNKFDPLKLSDSWYGRV